MVAAKPIVVVGLGKTGYSVVAFFAARNMPVVAMDTRDEPPFAQTILDNFPNVEMCLGKLDEIQLLKAEKVVVSPGLPLATKEIKQAQDAGIEVVSDIQIFADYAKAPIVAITGSNAKSTVTTLVGLMAQDAGLHTAIGGNLGTPALDLIDDSVQLYVMELSSFQLEATPNLNPLVATVLNISPDHLDRYDSYKDYYESKQVIFNGAKWGVINLDDTLSAPMFAQPERMVGFTINEPENNQFGVCKQAEKLYLCKGKELLLESGLLKIKGSHNRSNALAALALGECAGLPMNSMLKTLSTFAGLEHRCQWVRKVNGVEFYNDSKGTNVGATQAALEGLGPDIKGHIVLMAGGVGKDADFQCLSDQVKAYVSTLVVYGRDAQLIADVLHQECKVIQASSFEDAFSKACESAKQDDAVLLSPACASFDMFNSFEHRGETFVKLVEAS
ncbi:UDP-N-acetylmuramoyl-L-alanine--D-glutamate ligase [Oceaniserpentilla sp. 4NH20-0058]|uniref:UDP-N-acetylmuramoyl-L-alanine--D-glutamate ligase n=1 Tax=Oceaniserpentilla sp. 4NH20-0058 TaxID=3127660 RepID=UPI003104C4F1